MRSVYNDSGVKIGRFYGNFVCSLAGCKLYWIDESEVFSLLSDHDHQPWRRAAIKVGDLTGSVAKDLEEGVIFTIQ